MGEGRRAPPERPKRGAAPRRRTPPRRRLPPEERTRLILEAALGEFAAHGYAGASMAGTAARAGIAKGLIYHYFPGKAELFRAVIRSCVQPIFAEAERLAAGFQGPRAALLEALLEMAYGLAAADRRERILFKLVLLEAERFPELAELYRTEVLARALALTGRLLRAGVESGEFRPEAGEEGMAAVLLAPAIMASVWRMMVGPEAAPAPAAMERAHIRLALEGLLRRDAARPGAAAPGRAMTAEGRPGA